MSEDRLRGWDPPDAAVLVGGQGMRLRRVVADRPKPMALVAGKPFLEWLLIKLRSEGVKRVVLCTGFMSDVVRRHFGDGEKWDLEVAYSEESAPLGTGGAVRCAAESMQTDPFLVLNGDSYCDFSLRDLLRVHAANGAKATMWLVTVSDVSRFGAVRLDGAKVERFDEKAASGQGGGLINAGVYALQKETTRLIPEACACSLEREVFPGLVGKGLCAATGRGRFIDIGTPESYEEAQQMFGGRTHS